jgi:hypothetical protein
MIRTVLQTYLDNCNKLTDIAKGLWLKNGISIDTTQKGYGDTVSHAIATMPCSNTPNL